MVPACSFGASRPTWPRSCSGKPRRLADELGGGVYFCVCGEVGGPELDPRRHGADIVYMTDSSSPIRPSGSTSSAR